MIQNTQITQDHLSIPRTRVVTIQIPVLHQNLLEMLLTTFINTVKPFNLAALKVGDFACKIILAPSILANLNHTIRNRPIAVDIRAL